ncbi:MAG: DUF4446 family protein [Chloroflexi bacterium]|nr:DUF4446 family protein [Chloroflexota bacterium]
MPTISLDTALFIILGAAVLVLAVLLAVTIARLNKLAAHLPHSQQMQAEDGDVIGYSRDELRSYIGQQNHQLAALNMAQQRCLNRVGLVRFNPYDDTGGDLSFALALATNEGNGVLITSLHGRNNTRFYAKQLLNWNSAVSLSEEETDAVRRAQAL